MIVGGASAAFAANGPGISLNGSHMGSYYSNTTGGQTFCIDPRHAPPADGISYATSTVSAPETGYELSKYMPGMDNTTAAALAYLSQRNADVPHTTDRPPEFSNPGQTVLNRVAQIKTDAAAHKGPYTLTGATTTTPTATSGTVKMTFTVKSAIGAAMAGVPVTFTATGSATGRTPTSGTTNAAGQVVVTYTLANGATGGVKATATGLPATTVTMLTHSPASDGYQRVIREGAATSAAVTRAATRPAAPKSYVRVIKRDAATNAILAGGKFQIVNRTTGAVLASGTTNASGVWASPALNIAPGTIVRVNETGAPAGYKIDTASNTVATGATAPGPDITFNDTKISSLLRIHKTDAQTGAALAGAKFTVTGGNPSKTLGSGTTNTAGNIDLTLPVPAGTAVRVTETAAPAGYLIVTASTTAKTAAARPTVSFKNNEQGKVSLVKTDAATGKGLAGAVFAIHKGTASGATISTITSTTGVVTTGYLAGGVKVGDTVTLVETKAPAGFSKVANKALVVTRTGTARYTVADPRVAGSAAVAKVDSVTHAPLAGVTFKAEVQKVGTTAWVKLTGGAIGGTTTNAQGYVTPATGRAKIDGTKSTPKLAYGDNIRFTEVATAPGHVLPANAVTTGTIGTSGTLVVNVENQPIAKVHLVKYENGTTPHQYLPGATFVISRMVAGAKQILTTATTDANGRINWNATGSENPAIRTGDTLTFTETTAPAGYKLAAPVSVKVAEYAAGAWEGQTLTAEAGVRVAVAD
ncbi:MAG: SpaA isopeptide-forming pilin-related protein, partial [Actinomycetota bacterium]|nr:SpaA isopeptide-forming pilin-related protein [Actinomycetota bacterium]